MTVNELRSPSRLVVGATPRSPTYRRRGHAVGHSHTRLLGNPEYPTVSPPTRLTT